jgi:phosphoribosylformylglycinamidine cyclo-ligase
MRAAVESTRRAEVIGTLGGFAGAVRLPDGLADPLLVSATDGVGTKTAIAATLRRFDTIGIDLVAMCADDVVCTGAAPLFFLDYVAVGRLDPVDVSELVGSVAAGCRDAGCALVGGETAEHPGLMEPDEFDVAGFCVGIVERSRLLDASAARAGDAIVGIAASGLHANGFSLVRSLVAEYGLDLSAPYLAQLRRSLGAADGDAGIAAEPEHALATLGEVLLTPTRIYARAVLGLRDALEAAGLPIAGIAHITGGGLPGNLPRALPAGLGARVDPDRWRMPSIMRLLGALGSLDGSELRATFNGGVGMAIVVPPAAVGPAIAHLADAGLEAWHIGDVVEEEELGGARYAEAAPTGGA